MKKYNFQISDIILNHNNIRSIITGLSIYQDEETIIAIQDNGQGKVTSYARSCKLLYTKVINYEIY